MESTKACLIATCEGIATTIYVSHPPNASQYIFYFIREIFIRIGVILSYCWYPLKEIVADCCRKRKPAFDPGYPAYSTC